TQDDKNWFVLLRGKRYGPYTFAALAEAAERGVVDREAGVWCLGWDEWRMARSVPGLFKPEAEPEPEPEPDHVDEGVDTFADGADDREESRAEPDEDIVDEEDRGDDRTEVAAEENEPTESTQDVSGADLRAHGPAAETADLELDEVSSSGLT